MSWTYGFHLAPIQLFKILRETRRGRLFNAMPFSPQTSTHRTMTCSVADQWWQSQSSRREGSRWARKADKERRGEQLKESREGNKANATAAASGAQCSLSVSGSKTGATGTPKVQFQMSSECTDCVLRQYIIAQVHVHKLNYWSRIIGLKPGL